MGIFGPKPVDTRHGYEATSQEAEAKAKAVATLEAKAKKLKPKPVSRHLKAGFVKPKPA